MCIGLPKLYRMGKKALCGGIHQIGHYEAEHEEMVGVTSPESWMDDNRIRHLANVYKVM